VQQPARQLRVLVVDDNSDIVLTMCELVSALGHIARGADGGAAALVTAAEFAPHVVLLDIGMPDMDGYETARRLRTLQSTRETLIVACTAYSQETYRRRAFEAGFDRYEVKPIVAQTLIDIIAAAAESPA
jgi:CheY-like chemotaxis protein